MSRSEVEAIVAGEGDADEILRKVVDALHERYRWAGIFFVEGDQLVLGPAAGHADEPRRTRVPVRWRGRPVAELAVDGAEADDQAELERVAELLAGHCLVGWDTGGEDWRP